MTAMPSVTGAAPRGLGGGVDWADRLATAAMWLVALAVGGVFAAIVGDLLRHGAADVSWRFVLEPPGDAGRAGGIGPILVSTLAILAVTLAASVPLGTATAILLAEFSRGSQRLGRAIRMSLDVLSAVPSIVFGLFGNACFSLLLGLGFSILSGGLTLACMVLPLLIRSIEAALRAVPDDYRSAAAALGISHAAALRRILLPAATPGIVVGFVLAVGRSLAETAVLLFTSGYVDRFPSSIVDSGRALSVHIYDLAMNVPGGERRAYATALVLAALLLAINGLTFVLADRWRLRRITPA
jgi:phosphate transport system permease protein